MVADPEFYQDLAKEQNGYSVSNLAINSDEQEFGTAFYKEHVVFVSSRVGMEAVVRRYNWNQKGFLDIFQAEIDTSDFTLSNPVRHHKKFNKKYHEGPASFNKDGNIMVFTRNNYSGRSAKDEINLELYESKFIDGKWQKPKSLPFNSKEYSVGHGTLTPDGNRLYFVSDMPGGYGGSDIYRSDRLETGEWGDPVRMENGINTEGNEMFPYMHQDTVLFFASNGHPGLGGLDVFYIDLRETGIQKVTNLSAPVNSSKDDFAFLIDEDRKKGFFSSNRTGGQGDDDIYAFTREEPLNFYQLLRGRVIDEIGQVVPNTKVLLRNTDGEVIAEAVADEDGKYKFLVEENKKYSLIGEKEGHSRGLGKFETDDATRDFSQDLMVVRSPEVFGLDDPFDMSADGLDMSDDKLVYKSIDPNPPGLSIHSRVLDIQTGRPIMDVQIALYDKLTGEETFMESPETGDNTWILDTELYGNKRYAVKVLKDGYQPMEFDFETPPEAMGQHAFMTKLIPILEEGEKLDVDIAEVFDVAPIYFDLDRSEIRADAKVELDKIVELMNAKPNLEIEFSSHTDCRASKTYNERLSKRRAYATARYIKKRITKPSRISGTGFGENELANKCECEDQVIVECSEEEHALNRRTEFHIVKM